MVHGQKTAERPHLHATDENTTLFSCVVGRMSAKDPLAVERLKVHRRHPLDDECDALGWSWLVFELCRAFSRGPIPIQRTSTEGLASVVDACREHKPLEERLRQPCTLNRIFGGLGGVGHSAAEFI